MYFHEPPCVPDRSLLWITYYYLLLLFNYMFKLSFICIYRKYVWITCGLSMWSYIGLTHENLIHVTRVYLQSISCDALNMAGYCTRLNSLITGSILPGHTASEKSQIPLQFLSNTQHSLTLQGHGVWTRAIVQSVNICQTNMNSIPSSDVKMLDKA